MVTDRGERGGKENGGWSVGWMEYKTAGKESIESIEKKERNVEKRIIEEEEGRRNNGDENDQARP